MNPPNECVPERVVLVRAAPEQAEQSMEVLP